MAVEGSAPLAPGRAATAVTGAIRNAAQATGTSFNYLLATAKIESDLDPNLTMKSSSATGLFQFIDQTWLGTLKQAGPAFGYGSYANAIERDSSGRYVVPDPGMRREIMRLRTDPNANAVMAGVLTQQNAATLSRRIGRLPTEGELYIAHFFGAGGAGKVIDLLGSNPQTKAAEIFPRAAQANAPIFYDRHGNARSIAGVYAELVRRYKLASDGPGAVTASANLPVTGAARVANARAVAANAVAANAVAANAVPAVPASLGSSPPATSQPGPAFDSLFSDSERRTAIAPVVAALWSVPTADLPANGVPVTSPTAKSADKSTTGAAPLDLFQDMRPNVRALFGGST
jgi:hypothetical protein